MANKVYITRRIPPVGIDLFREKGVEIDFWDSDEAIPHQELVKNVKGKGYAGLLCLLTDQVDAEVFEAAGPSLKVVSTLSVGYEHIDLKACKARNIIACNLSKISTDCVSEFAVTLALAVSRRIEEGIAAVRNGSWGLWKPMWILGSSFANRTIGVLGMGRIGYGVARRMKAFCISRLIYHDIKESSFAQELGAEFVDLETLLKDSDVICICCNLTPATHYLFNKENFKKMKNTAILINTSRGGVINHDDLYDALKNHEIGAAGLDVTEPEPLPKEHRLNSLPNCVVTLHMGSNTWEARNNMSYNAALNIDSVFENQTPMGKIEN
uniref:Glyoxylate reductase/hydroxypyruvate reductase n=1 Tax=Octopus vulgaris TaxID=6645 RepID=Q9BLF6_OCTVU|nr:D-lactate dehydrogenase [Octopus vulgaris]